MRNFTDLIPILIVVGKLFIDIKLIMGQIVDETKCCGCRACSEVCPKQCIVADVIYDK